MGIGVDTVEIARFQPWATYPRTRLQRIFSEHEIDYCLSVPTLSAQRFAVRFAAREAFTKALHAAFPGIKFPLLTACKAMHVEHDANGAPCIQVRWDYLINKEAACPDYAKASSGGPPTSPSKSKGRSRKLAEPEGPDKRRRIAIHASFTHTSTYATAFLIVEDQSKGHS